MAVKVAINGFGRIGRNVLRAIVESGRTDVQVVAIKRSGQTFLPTGSASLQHGDLLYLAVQAASADRLKALLRGG